MNSDYAEQQRKQAALATLKQLYIGEPKRSSLAALPHVTREVILAWHQYLLEDMHERYRPGLLIRKLESGEDVPEEYYFEEGLFGG